MAIRTGARWVSLALAAIGFLGFTSPAGAAQKNLLANAGFEDVSNTVDGNNFDTPIPPWTTTPGANVVRVDGVGGVFFDSPSVQEDASGSGPGIWRHYLDFVGAGVAAQTIRTPCTGTISFGGYFATQGKWGGNATLRITTTINGAIVDVALITVALPKPANPQKQSWLRVEKSAAVTAGHTYDLRLAMTNDTAFDEAFVIYTTRCDSTEISASNPISSPPTRRDFSPSASGAVGQAAPAAATPGGRSPIRPGITRPPVAVDAVRPTLAPGIRGGGQSDSQPRPVNLKVSKALQHCDQAGSCTYLITVRNTGAEPFYGPIAIKDTFTLGTVSSLASTGPGVVCSFNSPSTICYRGGPAPIMTPFLPGASQNFVLTFAGPSLGGDIPRLNNCVSIYPDVWHTHNMLKALVAAGYSFKAWDGPELDAALKDFSAKRGVPYGFTVFGGPSPMLDALLGAGYNPKAPPTDDPSDNEACASYEPPPPPARTDLSLTSRFSGIEPSSGNRNFVLHPVNKGDALGAGSAVTVSGTLQQGLSLNKIMAGPTLPWACTITGQAFSCSWAGGPVAAGAAFPSMSLFTSVASPAAKYQICAGIDRKGVTDAVPSDNQTCASIP